MIDKIATFNENIKAIGYWLNPKNLYAEAVQGLDALVHSPETAIFLMAAAIISIIFRALDVRTPLKITFWTWAAYWLLRGFIFI